MNRKDTILIAVVINAGLLAILFATAVIYDTDPVLDESTVVAAVAPPPSPTPVPAPSLRGSSGDELDNVLSDLSRPTSIQPIVVEAREYVDVGQFSGPEQDQEENSGQNDFVEVRVKKGDVLDKISRAHGVSVSAIKKFNQLKSERLSIGQLLKIPPHPQEEVSVVENPPVKVADQKGEESDGVVYHTVKGGDSPWKIAKQYSVNYEEILKLNNINEEKARNLKIGEKIRVK